MLHHQLLMSLCVKKAWEFQTLTLPNPAVGAMIIDENGKILALQAHQKSGGPHAEVLALKEAYLKLTQDDRIKSLDTSEALHQFISQNHQGIFHSCTIYVTLEPCISHGKTPPCASLLQTIKPKKVIIGALEHTSNKGGMQLLQSNNIEVLSNILKKECEDLLLPFMLYQKNKKFNLFKIAQRLNGDYKSGTISSLESKNFTHNQRSVSQQIIISKNTLTQDNPTLDARFATPPFSNHLPSIAIITRDTNPIATNYKIFQDKRQISIHNTIPLLQEGFNIIEGGWELFESFKDQIDMLLLHISPTLQQNSNDYGFCYNGKILHHDKKGEDLLLWIQNS